ncbi:MAG: DUF484 family protein [Rhodobacteraceae bacterium]|nr:DUF484 family protein [Paracoccaceae bacterium]
MAKKDAAADAVREHILNDPGAVLNDRDVMRVLVSADESDRTGNVVDLRSIALERLEARLNRLENTHRHVIAAAYDNLASTNQIHRAVLAILEPVSLADFLSLVENDLAGMLNVDSAVLVLESNAATPVLLPRLQEWFGSGVVFCPPGDVMQYITGRRKWTARPVTLRTVTDADPALFRTTASLIRSEALLKLDLGAGNLSGMLVLGSELIDQFVPRNGVDLLIFFASAFERVLCRWLK